MTRERVERERVEHESPLLVRARARAAMRDEGEPDSGEWGE
jgi:hypothetical protein